MIKKRRLMKQKRLVERNKTTVDRVIQVFDKSDPAITEELEKAPKRCLRSLSW